MTESIEPLGLPSLRDTLAAVPDLVGRTVSVRASLATSTYAAVRIEPRPGELSAGDLPRRAHDVYGGWVDGLRRLGIVMVGAETRVDVEPADPQSRPKLTAADVDRLRAELAEAIGPDGAGPHDLMIHARESEVDWSFYGLADLPAHRRERVADLVDVYVRRGSRWLERSRGCALLIPDVAAPTTLSTAAVGCGRVGRHDLADAEAPIP